MFCRFQPAIYVATYVSTAALLLLAASYQPSDAAGFDVVTESLFLLPVDAPEQKVVQEAQAIGLPIPRIALVPPEMVRIYAENGRNAAETWCAGRASAEECMQAVTTLQEGPFIDHERGRIWLHTSLPLSKGKSAPLLQELARQMGVGKARQVIIAHEIAHVAFRSMSPDQLESAVRSGLDQQEHGQIKMTMFYDERFYEAFCNFFGVGLVARLAPEVNADTEHQRISHGLAEALRRFYERNQFYADMAYALDNGNLTGISTIKTWETLAIHAAQRAARLSLDKKWIIEE